MYYYLQYDIGREDVVRKGEEGLRVDIRKIFLLPLPPLLSLLLC